MKATSFSSSISANLGNSGEAIHKYSKEIYGRHTFVLFCELVEGEENKLTTFSTWSMMFGCNESNIIFQQHLCKLGQLRRSRPTGHTIWPEKEIYGRRTFVLFVS